MFVFNLNSVVFSAISRWPDWVNGGFELFGGIAIWLSVVALYKAKRFEGVSLLHWSVFALWGFWNLFFYSHLNQIVSLIAGINVVVANVVWLALAVYYKRKAERKQEERHVSKRFPTTP
jgi:Ca2+/Na+ antiporter